MPALPPSRVRRSAAIVATLVWLLAACSTAPAPTPDPFGDIYFPIHTIGMQDSFPTALAEGTLVMEDGCLFIRWPAGEENLVFWPAWVEIEGRPLRLIDRQSGATADVDGPIILGGGQFGLQTAPDHVRQLLGGAFPPERCARDHYWLASGILPEAP